MLMPDVNILVYAHRADEKRHTHYKKWLEELINGPQPFALSILVAVGFVGIVTTPRIFSAPTPLPTALGIIEQIQAHPRCRVAVPGSDHWEKLAQLCRACKAKGKLIADAQHAAMAISEGCTWVTADGDFAQFAPHGLRWQHLAF